MSNPGADDAKSPIEEPNGRIKRFYKKFKTPIKVLLSIYAFLLVCATLLSFPAVRAQLYPLTAIFQSPSFTITGYAPVFTTAEKPSFLIGSSKFLNYEFRVYDVTELNQFAKADLNDRGSYRENVPQGTRRYPCENFNYSELFKSTKNFSNFKPIATAAGPVRAQDLNSASMLLTLAEPLKPGDYLGVMAAPGTEQNVAETSFARFRVTDLGAVLKHDDDKILVSAVNLITRKPWSGAQVSLKNEHNLDDVVPACATDGNGIAILKRPANCSKENWQALILDIGSGAHGAYFGRSGQYEYFHGMGEADNFVAYWPSRYRAYLNTDRPVYRLGQTINFKGFVKKVSSNGLTNPGVGTELKMTISDPDGRQVKEESMRLDAAGGFAGIIKASESTKTGVYNINIMYPDQQSEGFGIPVQQYRKPDFKVDVTPVKNRFERGDRVRFKIQANYLFGAPLKDVKIKYRVSSNSNEDLRERLSERISPDSLFFKNWESTGRYSPYGDLEPFNAEGEIQTDGSGTGFVEFDVPVLNVENKQGPYQYKFVDSDFNVSVETTDMSRKTFTAEGRVPVTNGSFALVIDRPSSSVTRAGEPIAMRVKAIGYDKKPLAAKKVKAKLCRWKWTREPFNEDGHYEQNVVETIDVATDTNGVASVSFKTDKTFPSDSYYVTCESSDEKKRTVGDVTSVWLFGATNDYFMSQRSQEEQFSVELDMDIYRANETIKAIVKAPLKEGEEAYVLTSIEGASLRAYKQIKMTGPVALVEFPVDSTYMPNAFITASFVMPEHKPVTTSAIVKVSPLQNFVNLNLSTDKPRYKPGETVKYTVTAKTSVGQPVANMPLAASVIDEGIFQVFNDLKKTTYVGESQSDIYAAIYRRIENEVLTRFTFTKKHDQLPNQPPVFDGAGLLALHMPILMFTPYNYSGVDYASCDMVANSAGGGGAPRMESAERPVAAAPMPTEGGAAKNAPSEERSAASPASAPTPRVRSNFVDTAAWYPGLFTNAAGTATFSVKLPDDLTTWRATVYGATTGVDVGMQTNSVICTQDFLARLALPRFYTEHDETTISGLIHNLSLSDQAVNVSLATSSNIQLLDGPTFRINIPRDGATRQSWKIKVLKPGVATITLKAVGPTLADAEERKLPLRPFGYRVYFAKNGLVKDVSKDIAFPINLPPDAELSNGAFDISASASAIGPVLGNFEKLIEYPYGCTEQTLSKLIPSVVAKRLSAELRVQMEPRMTEKFDIAYKMAMPKLSEYQHDDGGWGWWRDDHSDPYMTAHVLEGYYLLRRAGMPVDEERIERARVFLRNSLSSLTAGTWGRFESENQAKAVYALSLFGDELDPLTRTWQFTNIKSMTPEALSYLILAFKNVGDKTAANQLYERLKELRTDSLEYSNWEHNAQLIEKLGLKSGFDYTYRFTSVETTALALRASVRMEPNNDELLEKVTRWLILERDENGWNNTKTTAAVFLALLEKELGQDHNRATKFTARLEALNNVVKEFEFNQTYERGERSATILIDRKPGSISLKKNGPGWLYYNTLLAYDRRLKPGEQPVLKSVPADLKVTREWFRLVKSQKSKPGRTLYKSVPLGDNETIKVGDIIKMVVSVDCPFAVPYSLIEAFIPSGGEILAQPPEMEVQVQSEVDSQAAHWYWWTHQDVLDDRIAFFASEMPSGDARFTAYMRMEMPGKFNVNPVNMEGMYTNKVHARSKAQLIRVVE